MNKTIIAGTLGMDPELKYTNSGAAVLRLRVATNEVWFKDQQKQQHTEWHTVVVWGKRGEALSKILFKGSRLIVEGKLRTRQWEDKSGGKRSATEINAEDVELMGDSGQRREEHHESPAGGGYHNGSERGPFDGTGDDIPF